MSKINNQEELRKFVDSAVNTFFNLTELFSRNKDHTGIMKLFLKGRSAKQTIRQLKLKITPQTVYSMRKDAKRKMFDAITQTAVFVSYARMNNWTLSPMETLQLTQQHEQELKKKDFQNLKLLLQIMILSDRIPEDVINIAEAEASILAQVHVPELKDLKFSVRTMNTLTRDGNIKNLIDLASCDEKKRLRKIRGLGKQGVAEVKKVLSKYSLRPGMKEIEIRKFLNDPNY